MSNYQITEQDIEGMLRFLRVFDPKNANRDYAKEVLEYFKAAYHRLALTNPDALDEMYQAFLESKKQSDRTVD